MPMEKRKHQKDFVLEHEGKRWIVDIAEWFDAKTGKGELRMYRVEGDITTPLLNEALELEAQSRALNLSLEDKRLGYICFYGSRRWEVYAESLLDAKKKAVAHFKVRPNQAHKVSVTLAEKEGEVVLQSAGAY